MDNIFWSTCPTEMLWYSNLKYNQPGVHFCNYYKYSGPPYTFIASIWKLLFVLAFLSFDMQEGASLKKDFKPHWKKVIFLSQIVGWNPTVQWSPVITSQRIQVSRDPINPRHLILTQPEILSIIGFSYQQHTALITIWYSCLLMWENTVSSKWISKFHILKKSRL